MSDGSLNAAYFERLYSSSDDPWDFVQSSYEHAKYRETLAVLGARAFSRALEIGCSVGVLTAQLAPKCRDLLAVDINERALASAAKRCHGLGVQFERMTVPREFPAGSFDFVMLSEVGYYWSDLDLEAAIERIARAASGGLLELVHFLPKVADYVRCGDAVHEAFLSDTRFSSLTARRYERYRIDLLSVA